MQPGLQRLSPKFKNKTQCTTSITSSGIIYHTFCGSHNGTDILKDWQVLEKAVKTMRTRGKRVLILVNLSKVGRFNISARLLSLELARSLDFDKAAISGGSMTNITIAQSIIRKAVRDFQIQFFNDDSEARQWLLDK